MPFSIPHKPSSTGENRGIIHIHIIYIYLIKPCSVGERVWVNTVRYIQLFGGRGQSWVFELRYRVWDNMENDPSPPTPPPPTMTTTTASALFAIDDDVFNRLILVEHSVEEFDIPADHPSTGLRSGNKFRTAFLFLFF